MVSDTLDRDASWRRLRWRCRRGLLENDLLLTRFLDGFDQHFSDDVVFGLDQLLNLSDNELLDLVLARQQLEGELLDPRVIAVLEALRRA
ncbi:MAG: succinate dehydrogenase assembly factor 2 [Betaproteobacteria bacterium]|jgi:antitoxin CptB|nr:succinate dehydrogenase assembly factor 2 [Pseudomonadota bacterium]NBO04201.1 succinate dehydrogenase assembly factor 2 [Betaproteobacteria bacterium]NBO94646.1 succinate dehydrogenase assembly factor 2 [Betaproteobacteria bacterium]NBP34148.1 succinate dehydrogenase assembly factor 2 [Betaproteobacteria bacterium]NBP38260.1 succinate dehydrogenase assembly factor 2 [Betaproteobacteria bacterium]